MFNVGDLVEIGTIKNEKIVFDKSNVYEIINLPSLSNCGNYLLFDKSSAFERDGETWGNSIYVSPSLIRTYTKSATHYDQLKLF